MPEMENKIPDFVSCIKCTKLLDVKICSASPDADTPREKVIHIFEPRYPHFSVRCTECGQYSVFSPYSTDGDG